MSGSPVARGGPQVIPRPAEVVVGGEPPWAHHIGRRAVLGSDDVVAAFDGLGVERSLGMADPELRRSAVAVVLSEVPGGDLEVLLTRRAWGMRTHRGEVAFPGGAVETGDEFPVGTALREANEEVGLVASSVSVVGALDPLTTFTSDRVVVPVVTVTQGRPQVVAAPEEVDAILHVPITELLDPECYRQERWSWAGERDHVMHFYELPGDTVWGATAAMLTQLLGVLLP